MYKETFVSPVGVPTKESALRILNDIREAHADWVEISGYVEKGTDGWHAIRIHQKP